MRWLIAVFDMVLPRHRVAEDARHVSDDVLAALMRPTSVGRYTWIHALWPYHDLRIRNVIKAIKYYGERDLAERVAALATDYVLELIADKQQLGGWRSVHIVPLPSSQKRLRDRGYNQSERIAQAMFAAIIPSVSEGQVKYNSNFLARDDRPSQVTVMRSARAHNIRGAFRVPHPELVKGLFIILIDDVVESGATLNEARRALLESGARDVIALALAH